VIELVGGEVGVVIDTRVGCAADGWMDVDDGGREESRREEERRGLSICCPLSSITVLSLATGRHTAVQVAVASCCGGSNEHSQWK